MAFSCATTQLCISNNNLSFLKPSLSPQLSISKARNVVKCIGSVCVNAPFGSSKGDGGAAVLERPKFDQSQFNLPRQLQEEGDIGQVKVKRGPGNGDSYRVLLIDDVRHTETLVAKVLPQAVPFVTPDEARRLFSESRDIGVAVVIVTVKEHAEFYAQMMIRGGLRSKIEPESNTA